MPRPTPASPRAGGAGERGWTDFRGRAISSSARATPTTSTPTTTAFPARTALLAMGAEVRPRQCSPSTSVAMSSLRTRRHSAGAPWLSSRHYHRHDTAPGNPYDNDDRP